MPVTLLDVAQATPEKLSAGIMLNLLRYSRPLDYLSVVNTGNLTSITARWKSLPSVGFRKVNEGYTEATGTLEQVQEGLYFLGHDIKIDTKLEKLSAGALQDPRQTQIDMAMTAIGFKFNDVLINGNHATDPDEFEGLKTRVAALPAQQTIRPGTGTDAYDVTTSQATIDEYIATLHELLFRTEPTTALFCNRSLREGTAHVLRKSGRLDTTKDQFDRVIFAVMNVPIVDIGLKADKSTEIITNTEDPGDAGNDTTSMYAVRAAEPDGDIESPGSQGLVVLQDAPLSAYNPLGGENGEMESGPQKLIRLDWAIGLSNMGDDYNIARMTSVETPASWT